MIVTVLGWFSFLGGGVYLWADGVYINQQDEEEKSWQVAQMWDIYKSQYVMIWLEPSAHGSNILMENIRNP